MRTASCSLFAAACLSLIAGACGGRSVPLDMTRYDTACTVDDDCVLVTDTVCQVCGCGEDAIASSSFATYQADVEAIACAPSDGAICGACEQWVTRCTDGECTAGPFEDTASDGGP